jgi:hypothetical protein
LFRAEAMKRHFRLHNDPSASIFGFYCDGHVVKLHVRRKFAFERIVGLDHAKHHETRTCGSARMCGLGASLDYRTPAGASSGFRTIHEHLQGANVRFVASASREFAHQRPPDLRLEDALRLLYTTTVVSIDLGSVDWIAAVVAELSGIVDESLLESLGDRGPGPPQGAAAAAAATPTSRLDAALSAAAKKLRRGSVGTPPGADSPSSAADATTAVPPWKRAAGKLQEPTYFGMRDNDPIAGRFISVFVRSRHAVHRGLATRHEQPHGDSLLHDRRCYGGEEGQDEALVEALRLRLNANAHARQLLSDADLSKRQARHDRERRLQSLLDEFWRDVVRARAELDRTASDAGCEARRQRKLLVVIGDARFSTSRYSRTPCPRAQIFRFLRTCVRRGERMRGGGRLASLAPHAHTHTHTRARAYRRAPCYVVNEHLTSQCCPACEGHLDDDRTIGEGDRVGRYKRCRSVHCRGRVWQRDLVGATNILKAFVHLVLYGERPRCLRRSVDGDDTGSGGKCARALRVCLERLDDVRKALMRASKRLLPAAAATNHATSGAAASSATHRSGTDRPTDIRRAGASGEREEL